MLSVPASLIASGVEILGRHKEVPVDAFFANVVLTSDLKVYLLDHSNGGLQVIDATTQALGTVANSFDPFSGSVIPAAATLKVYDSTDGLWATNAIVPTLGNIVSFKTTGWHRVAFGSNTSRTAWRPSISPHLAVPSLKYILIELDDGSQKDAFILASQSLDIEGFIFRVDTAGGTGAAVKISNIQAVKKPADFTHIDLTTRSAGDPNVVYAPTTDTVLLIPGGEAIYGFDEIPIALIEYVQRQNGAGSTYRVEATGAGTSWIDITNQFTSASNFRQNGPVTTTTPPTKYESSVPAITGFTKRSIGDLKLVTGVTFTTLPKYYVRTAIISTPDAPQNVSIYRLRSLQHGNVNVDSMTFPQATTLTAANICIRGIKSGSGDTTIQLKNARTGETRNLIIPDATTVQGTTVPFTFANLAFAAGDKMLIAVTTAGASYGDATIYLMEAA